MDVELESQNEGQSQRSFQKLPPEVLMEIHKCLDVKSLLRCRKVSRQWCGISSQVSGFRADLELRFNFYRYESNPDLKIQVKIKNRKRAAQTDTSLREFIQIFSNSQNFPFSRCRFDRVTDCTFENENWLHFLSQFGEKIKCLKFGATPISEAELIKLAEKMSGLILNKKNLPNLQEFGLQFLHCPNFENAAKIPFFGPFPTSTTTTSEIGENPSTSSSSSESVSKQGYLQKSSEKILLPRLKVLHFDEFMFSQFTKILTDLLGASINLTKIEPFKKRECYKSLETFQFLQSLGKLGCVKRAEMKLTPEFLSKLKDNPAAPLGFKLKELDLCVGSGYKSNRVKALSTIFLSNLFESCKNSLEELTTDVVGYFQDLQIPNFSKLNSLKILQMYYCKSSDLFLPSGFNFGQVFPVLRSLDMENPWQTIFPQEGADAGSHSHSESDSDTYKTLPTLTTLSITGREMTGLSIAQISARCPNLKDLSIKSGAYNFPEVGSAIWTELKTLESLKLIVDVHAPANAVPAIDSCITGFSREECLRLQRELEADIPQSELSLKAERENPSILDLRDLKHFEIRLASAYSAIDDSHREILNSVMNRICVDYAFKLMDNLVTYNIFGSR